MSKKSRLLSLRQTHVRSYGRSRRELYSADPLAFLSRMIASFFLCERERKEVVFWVSTVGRGQGFRPPPPRSGWGYAYLW
jgi:hypothetical protein